MIAKRAACPSRCPAITPGIVIWIGRSWPSPPAFDIPQPVEGLPAGSALGALPLRSGWRRIGRTGGARPLRTARLRHPACGQGRPDLQGGTPTRLEAVLKDPARLSRALGAMPGRQGQNRSDRQARRLEVRPIAGSRYSASAAGWFRAPAYGAALGRRTREAPEARARDRRRCRQPYWRPLRRVADALTLWLREQSCVLGSESR